MTTRFLAWMILTLMTVPLTAAASGYAFVVLKGNWHSLRLGYEAVRWTEVGPNITPLQSLEIGRVPTV